MFKLVINSVFCIVIIGRRPTLTAGPITRVAQTARARRKSQGVTNTAEGRCESCLGCQEIINPNQQPFKIPKSYMETKNNPGGSAATPTPPRSEWLRQIQSATREIGVNLDAERDKTRGFIILATDGAVSQSYVSKGGGVRAMLMCLRHVMNDRLLANLALKAFLMECVDFEEEDDDDAETAPINPTDQQPQKEQSK